MHCTCLGKTCINQHRIMQNTLEKLQWDKIHIKMCVELTLQYCLALWYDLVTACFCQNVGNPGSRVWLLGAMPDVAHWISIDKLNCLHKADVVTYIFVQWHSISLSPVCTVTVVTCTCSTPPWCYDSRCRGGHHWGGCPFSVWIAFVWTDGSNGNHHSPIGFCRHGWLSGFEPPWSHEIRHVTRLQSSSKVLALACSPCTQA